MFGTNKNFGESLGERTAEGQRRDAPRQRQVRLFRMLAPAIGAFAQSGRLQISYRGLDEMEFGNGAGAPFRIRLNSLLVILKVIQNPDIGSGECFMNGDWELERGDLAALIGLFCRNEQAASQTVWGRRIRHLTNLLYKARRIGPRKARRNAAHHYDLGNDLYDGFLDKGMNYSCAFFESPRQSLRDAQLNKLRTTIRRLGIEPGSRVLDIGCGWGELTRLIALETPASHATGITLAENQYRLARDRACALPGNRPDYRLVDYRVHARDNPGAYDRIVSIGMFEHVGAKNFVQYFDAVRRMLAEDGKALIHTIMRLERSDTSPWIQKYIFPGGYIPTLEDTVAAAREAGLELAHEPYIHGSFHYAETLRRWRANFVESWPHLDRGRYDERFRRMWTYYLAGSEAAFDVNGMYVGQLLLRNAG